VPVARPRAELLAPAGGPPALQAALSAGADAVYLGLDTWSARAFAANFAPEALLAAIDRAHLHGARVHLALNVLLKDDELDEAVEALNEPYRAGLDALIVADLGFARLVHEAYPELELHASTQLGTHSSAQLERLDALGFTRAILARELSLDEIAALEPHGLGLEAFVHGALCYGYSGACLLSSMASGRSGNRGRCSQACRLRYRLDGGAAAPTSGAASGAHAGRAPSGALAHRAPSGAPPARRGEPGAEPDLPRVLSTGDLAAIAALPALLAAGVTSFKIEGRMKDAGYVAVTTAVYREALDATLADPGGYVVAPRWLSRLEQSFSRGFTTAHLDGEHAGVRAAGRHGNRGLQVGRVEAVDEARGEATVRVEHELHEADVVQIYTTRGATQPAPLSSLLVGRLGGKRVVLRLPERVSIKDRVFRTSSGLMDLFAADAVAGRVLARPIALDAVLSGRRGEPPRLQVSAAGETATATGGAVLEAARTAALSADKARRAIGALGGTPYELEDFDFAVDDDVFLGVGDLKALRRAALAALDERRLAGRRRAVPAAPLGTPLAPAAAALAPAIAAPRAPVARPAVVVRLRPGEQMHGVGQVDAVCLDLRSGDDPRLVARAATALRRGGLQVRARSPEVLFDADETWARAMAAIGWDAVYARHVAALSWAPRVFLEYPLQGLNSRAVALYGADGVVCPPELALADVARLAGGVVEALVFGREQVLVSRDTLGIAEALVDAPGASSAPAAAGAAAAASAPVALTLTDARGYAFPVLVAPGETRIFNSRVTNLCGHSADLAAAGVGGVVVVQSDMSDDERRAFARSGPAGLAAFDDRERFTTGHLYRGVG
jgi:putative protease